MTVLLGSGREADVYAHSEGRVLRRYRHGGDAAPEAETMAYVARFDFPVPAVYEVRGPDLILEHLHGPTLATAALAGRLEVVEIAGILAGLHRQLHDVPPRAGRHPGDRILHLDLHPENIMLTARGPVVIDWRNATEGPPDLDVALSALILAQAATEQAYPMIGPVLTAFLRLAGGDPLSILDRALDLRCRQLGVELADLQEAAAYLNRVSRS
ncbi:phosphotransferase [Actinoplanes sp. NBC_00393]|uniref:phosphotransferase n=1 Tax=Actinoplanes sp. NBC_00393 TaxID=2975953 RepID=UPI002E1FDC01